MAARIGMPLCLDEEGRGQAGREVLYTDVRYARAVEEAGGVLVHLPIQDGVDALLEPLDGLLLPGGDDLPPPEPGPPEGVLELAPARQVAFDRGLLAAALARGMPVLGICYGMQLLALHHGGHLLYHLPHDRPGGDCHQRGGDDARHDLVLEPGTRLQAILGPRPGPVNSHHHQGVAEPGEGMRVAARAADGLVEAIEHLSRPFCIGVQWHPERMSGPHHQRLFRAFVEACGGGRGGGGPG